MMFNDKNQTGVRNREADDTKENEEGGNGEF